MVLEKDAEYGTTHHRSFYTDLTRARDEAVVATDSADRLAQRVSRDDTKVAALDVATSSERAGALEREFGGV